MARKYARSAAKDVEREMRKFKRGTLKSGRGGKGGTVKSRRQAIAIGLQKRAAKASASHLDPWAARRKRRARTPKRPHARDYAAVQDRTSMWIVPREQEAYCSWRHTQPRT
jgi:hypothetical protein